MGKVIALTFATGLALVATTVLTGTVDAAARDAAQPAAVATTVDQAAPLAAASATGTVTRFRGLAFDTCRAPSLRTMQAWKASPYRAIGIYISGDVRACKHQPHLTREWVAAVTAAGWKLIPIDVSQQAPCYIWRWSRNAMDHDKARAQGARAARKSVRAAQALGILPGSALYSDIEHYGLKPSRSCIEAVADFLDGWTTELHKRGYLAGLYGHALSGIPHAANRYFSEVYARLDAVWMAHWDHRRNLRNWPGVSDRKWAGGRRIKQYRGDHTARFGGVALRIDANVVDAPVATVSGQLLQRNVR
jgi:hypothetical protein